MASFLKQVKAAASCKKAGKVLTVTFVADRQTAVAGQPRQGAFDLPPIPSEALAGVDTAARNPYGDAVLAQPSAVNGLVVAFVRPGLRRRSPRRDVIAGIAATIDCNMTVCRGHSG